MKYAWSGWTRIRLVMGLLLMLAAMPGCGSSQPDRLTLPELELRLLGKTPAEVEAQFSAPSARSGEVWHYAGLGKLEVKGPASSYWQTMDVVLIFQEERVAKIKLTVNRAANGSQQ